MLELRARLYARAQDPFIFTSYKGWDPEAGFSAGSGVIRRARSRISSILGRGRLASIAARIF